MRDLQRIYLINPSMQSCFYSLSGAADLTDKPGFIPNLALPTLAALTPADIEVEVCDETVDPVDFDKPCDLVGITGYVTQARRMFELARTFRERGRLVAIGGPFASLSPEQCRPYADILFTGEAERTWPVFLEDFRRGSHKDTYHEPEKPEITRSPAPRMDVLRNDLYISGVIQTSRGCPFECEFCDVIVYLGRRMRHKSVEQILCEADALYEHGYRSAFLSDDNFTAHRKKATEILSALRDWNENKQPEPVLFSTQLSVDAARDPELLGLCADAGLRVAFIGIETPNKDSLQEVKKRQNLASDLLHDIRAIQSHGIAVLAGMIVGFDHDTTDVFREQFEFLQAASIPICAPGMLNAPAGTPLEDRLRREGRLISTRDDFYVETNIVPKQMSRAELEHGLQWLLNRLYHPPHFLERVLKVFEIWPESDSVYLGVGAAEAMKLASRIRRSYAALGAEFEGIPDRCFRAARKASALGAVGWSLLQYKHIVTVMQQTGKWDPALATSCDPWERSNVARGGT
jgi:radical SAM superfamily enzyme YgiQ (UPF0313 family)